MWWKKNKWKVLIPVIIAAVLAFAFWYGGDAPGMQGWKVKNTPESAEIPAPADNAQQSPNTEPASESTAPAEQGAAQTASIPETDAPSQESESAVTEAPEEKPAEEPAEEIKTEEPDTPAPENTEPSEPQQTADTVPTEAPFPTEPQEPAAEPETGGDPYMTDPVPEDNPQPVEPQDTEITDKAYTCTISISCKTILDHMDWLNPEKTELVPADGCILPPTTVTFYEGESVFNVLQRICKQEKIHMEFMNTPMYNSAYIEGINNLYEFDCGELSGWMYSVNGWFPNYGCSRYELKNGDIISWEYTCDLGVDVGGYYAAGG